MIDFFSDNLTYILTGCGLLVTTSLLYNNIKQLPIARGNYYQTLRETEAQVAELKRERWRLAVSECKKMRHKFEQEELELKKSWGKVVYDHYRVHIQKEKVDNLTRHKFLGITHPEQPAEIEKVLDDLILKGPPMPVDHILTNSVCISLAFNILSVCWSLKTYLGLKLSLKLGLMGLL